MFELIAVAALMLCVVEASAVEWKMKDSPIKTRWAKQVSPQNALPDYPRPQMVRKEWQNLNGLWEFSLAKENDRPPVGKSLAETILVPYPIESALSGVMKRAERVWYRRTFSVPEKWKNKRLLLHFGAVDWEATVYVNGKEIGSHKGGYDPFSFDMTDALNGSGEQEIIVRVYDPSDKGDQPRGKQVNKPEGIWYTPSTGIWQTVWLEPVPEAHIAELIITPDVNASCLRLTVKGAGDEALTIEAAARDGRQSVASANGKLNQEFKIPLSNLKLWSPDHPFLYGLKVSLKKGSKTLDSVDSYFGMRKVEVKSDGKVQRLMLNDEFVFQVGLLDQGFWPDGLYTAPTDEALKYDIEMTKKLGFNLIRKHVKVEPARWYYWADKLGVLVWQDMPSANNRTLESRRQFELELERMIDTHRNYPSIITWVVFNEGWGQYDTKRLAGLARQFDPTRLINNPSGWTDAGAGDMMDIHTYPDPKAPNPEAKRAAVIGEFGGLGFRVKGHTWENKIWGYEEAKAADTLNARYVGMLERIWEFKDNPGISAVVYTQTTDVETECNGLMTYDREVVKFDVKKIVAANKEKVKKSK